VEAAESRPLFKVDLPEFTDELVVKYKKNREFKN
jgi:hypothetical protein